jgi:hypothetical protein
MLLSIPIPADFQGLQVTKVYIKQDYTSSLENSMKLLII